MLFNFILLQEAGGGGGEKSPGQNPLITLLMFGSIIVVFYLFMIRPQQRRARQETKFREALQKGDKVTTIGGLYGRVVNVEDSFVMVEIDNGVKVKMEKAAIKPIVEAPAKDKK